MNTLILVCLFVTDAAVVGTNHQTGELHVPDALRAEIPTIQYGEDSWDTLSLLQRASRKNALQHNVNTTQMMASEAYEGYRWMKSMHAAACKDEAAHARGASFRGTLPDCKAKCLEADYCTAVDFHNAIGRCDMYAAPCDMPAAMKDGSSSYRLHIFMSSPADDQVLSAPQDHLHRPGHVSLAQRQEPETVTDEKTELESATAEEFEPDEFENEYLEEQVVAAISVSMIFVFIVTHVMHRRHINLLPEAAMIIMQGVLLGLVLKYWADSTFTKDPVFRCEISIKLLNLVFLPLLMFESGWAVRRLDFISQFPYIMIFAVVGTLISTFVIGMLIYKSGQAGLHSLTHYRGAFIVASLISTTDPVATLATYSHLKVDPLLNILVFGEACINDAVGIVVFSIVNDDEIMAHLDSVGDMIIYGGLSGFRIMACSFLLGLLVSCAVCWSLKVFHMHDNKKLEIMIIVCTCYLSFALGEYFKVSGIICTLFCGMLMGQYARPHLSAEGSLLTSFFISQMCMVMDAGIFLLSGVCCICLSWRGQQLGYWLLLFCAIGRICSTLPCGMITNCMKHALNKGEKEEDRHILSGKYLFMMWHAGLRGGIAENLSMQIGPWINELEGAHAKEAIRSSVFMVVVAYVLVFGGTTRLFLQWFDIPMGTSYAEDALSLTESGLEDSRLLNFLHYSIFKPMLVGEQVEQENEDVTVDAEADVEDLLKQLCHNHRGAKTKQDNAVEVLHGLEDSVTSPTDS